MKHSLDGGWGQLFEQLDAGVRGVPIVRRHPFFDQKVVELLLGLPSLPWCVDKWALRVVQRDRLPALLHRRPKTPLAGEPWPGVAGDLSHLWRQFKEAAPDLGQYLHLDHIEATLKMTLSERDCWAQLGPALSFACWRARWNIAD